MTESTTLNSISSIIWLSGSTAIDHDDYRYLTANKNDLMANITFVDDSTQFLQDSNDLDNEEAYIFVIIYQTIDNDLLTILQDKPSVKVIFILSDDQSLQLNVIKSQYSKMNGVYNNIILLCRVLMKTLTEYDKIPRLDPWENYGSKRFIKVLDKLNSTDRLRIILVNILLGLKFSSNCSNNLLSYFDELLAANEFLKRFIDEFRQKYQRNHAYQLYTKYCFYANMMNDALASCNIKRLILMGFCIFDLHQQLEKLHGIQKSPILNRNFETFCPKNLPIDIFATLENGKLLTSDNFWSAYRNIQVAQIFLNFASDNTETVPVIFRIINDFATETPVCADMKYISRFPDEDEVLYSPNCIFEIQSLKKKFSDELYWICTLSVKYIMRFSFDELEYINEGSNFKNPSSLKLNTVLINESEYDKTLNLLEELVNVTDDVVYKCQLQNIMISLYNKQRKDEYAIKYFLLNQALIQENSLENHQEAAKHYENTGVIHKNKGQYSEALYMHKKALEIRQAVLSENHSEIASSYENIGDVLFCMGEYLQALENEEKALEILDRNFQKSDLQAAKPYEIIAFIQEINGTYLEAFKFFRKSTNIRQAFLPRKHPDLVRSCHKVGSLQTYNGNYSEALSLLCNVMRIQEEILHEKHPDLTVIYNDLAFTYLKMNDYDQAILLYRKAIAIGEDSKVVNHQELVFSYINISLAYYHRNNNNAGHHFYIKALYHDKKSIEGDHIRRAFSYNSFASIHCLFDEYSRALNFAVMALNIVESQLLSDHPVKFIIYDQIAIIYRHVKQYEKTTEYCQKSIKYYEQTIGKSDRIEIELCQLAKNYHQLGLASAEQNKHENALSFYHESAKKFEMLSDNEHPDLAKVYNNMGCTYEKLSKPTKACLCFERARLIERKHKSIDETH